MDLSWVSRAGRPVGYQVGQPNASNYLKVSMPSAAKFGGGKSLVTLEQVSADPCMTYPIFDLRRVIDNGSVDNASGSINYLQKVGTVPLADMVQKMVGLEEPYAVLELRTDKVSIADYDGDRTVDANDYNIWVKDYGKTGPSASDIASLKDAKIVLGIPDGRVDHNDLQAFEQERARFADRPGRSIEGFEGVLGKAWAVMGDAPWRITSGEAFRGSQSIQAGAIGDNQTSELLLDRDCQKGTIRFWRKTSCEPRRDWYRFLIDDVEQEGASGETEWQQVSFPINRVGRHFFEWRYEKDVSSSYGADTVWIDDVEIVSE